MTQDGVVKSVTSVRDSHCSYCGHALSNTASYPRTCDRCGAQTWANPIPVGVALVPVAHAGRTGLLVVRRAIEPKLGMIALVGGFLEEHESWQVGSAREVREETGVTIDPARLEPFWFVSTEPRPNRVLLFSVADAVASESFPPFEPSPETSARGLVFGPEGLEQLFAFPLHAQAARRYFEAQAVAGPHDFTSV